MTLSPQWLDELRARVTLSSVVMRTTKLQKAGREWKACCPFHNEKTPSFTVNDEKGFYHCFGCGAHGDVIRWMTDQRGLAFMDAVKELAAEAGLEVPAPDPRAAQQAEQRAGLHDVMAAAQDWFRASLDTPEGARARAYLKSRGFDAHTMERFGFGYAPDGRQALKTALAQFDEPMLIEAGLRIAVEEREPYDRFRDRLTMPIHDARGRVIGFAARILDAEKKDAPKYLNSPDTPLFDKGRTLFNLHRAGPASRKSGRIVVVEGQMDVIALAAAGIEEAVAPMGTALTERQIELLWRLVDKPILCFDGDAAGQRAAMRAAVRALPLLRPGHSLQFVTLPAGMDPDDLLKRKGRDGARGAARGARRACSTRCGSTSATPPRSPRPRTRPGSRRGCSTMSRRSSTPTSARSTAATCSTGSRPSPSPSASSPSASSAGKRGANPAIPLRAGASEKLRRSAARRRARRARAGGPRRPRPPSRPDRAPCRGAAQPRAGRAATGRARSTRCSSCRRLEAATIAHIAPPASSRRRRTALASPSSSKEPIRRLRARTWPRRWRCWSKGRRSKPRSRRPRLASRPTRKALSPSSSGCANESWKSSRDSGRWPGNAPRLRRCRIRRSAADPAGADEQETG